MGDLQELGHAMLIGIIFSYLVAKLISAVISYREEHLKLVREKDLAAESNKHSNIQSSFAHNSDRPRVRESDFGDSGAEESLSGEDDDDDDDDWDEIESTELDEIFSAATAFVAATAANRTSTMVSNDVQLQLYGFYKIATEGPCTTPQPSALNVTARAKWNAWHHLGAIPPDEAMQKYIEIVHDLFPSWASSSSIKNKHEDASSSSSAAKGAMGPVFSSLMLEEESENDLKLDEIHILAREGEVDGLLKHIENGISVNLKDSEGRTPLHWAVDRGHLQVVEMLLSRNANVNEKDDEGQTSLHYAALCEREAFAELLVKHGADPEMKDDDGNSPSDLCTSWDFLISA